MERYARGPLLAVFKAIQLRAPLYSPFAQGTRMFPMRGSRERRKILMKNERNFYAGAVFMGCICLLPIVGFVLVSLWPQRVLVSWLLLGLVALVIIVRLALWVLKAGMNAKVRLSEEGLRPGRLYANERLVEHEGRDNDEWAVQQQRVTKDELYVQRPYIHPPHRQLSEPYEVPYSGLKPLSIDSDDWE